MGRAQEAMLIPPLKIINTQWLTLTLMDIASLLNPLIKLTNTASVFFKLKVQY